MDNSSANDSTFNPYCIDQYNSSANDSTFNPYCIDQYKSSARDFSPDPIVYSFEYISGAFCCIGTAANLLLLAVVLRSPLLRKGVGIVIVHLF